MHQNAHDSRLDLLGIKVPGGSWKLICPQVGKCESGFALMKELVDFLTRWGPTPCHTGAWACLGHMQMRYMQMMHMQMTT